MEDARHPFRICRACFGLDEETLSDTVQRCACRRERDELRWDRYDYNEHTRLCDCCLGVELQSGSRWSVWFCLQCQGDVTYLNGSVGRLVLPIGRHTLMNGVPGRPEGSGRGTPIDDPAIERFAEELAEGLGGIFRGMEMLRRWKRYSMEQMLDALGFPANKHVDLSAYLLALRRSADPSLSRRARFEAMVEFIATTADERNDVAERKTKKQARRRTR